MPLAMWCATIGVAQWYTYTPGLSALKLNVADSPGATWVTLAPPPGPVTACRSMLCVTPASAALRRVISTVSPSRTRSIGPGTVPLKVQYS
jgi:hypothetical protein